MVGVAELDEVFAKPLAGGREREAAAAVGFAVLFGAAGGRSGPGAGFLRGEVFMWALCVGRPLLDHPDVEDAGRHEAHYGHKRPPLLS